MTETPSAQQSTSSPIAVAIPSGPLPAHEHKILGRSNGLGFLNLELELQATEGTLFLNSTGQQNNFVEMSKDRGNPNNLQMSDQQIDQAIFNGQKLPLANVGVSVAVVLEINGEDYLILARRPNGMLLLPSGYVDSANQNSKSKFAELALATALKELTEEIVVRDKDNKTDEMATRTFQVEAATDNIIWASVEGTTSREYSANSTQVKLNLAPAYEAKAGEDLYDLNYQTSNPVVIKPTNDLSFLPSLGMNQQVVIDGQVLEHGAFYYLRETRSGQLVYPFRMEIHDITGISLQHAETGPDRNGKPGDLLEVLDPEGLILARISPSNGFLTADTFHLVDGELVATGLKPDQLILSEVFNSSFIAVDQGRAFLAVTLPREVGDAVVKTASFQEYQNLALTNLRAQFPEW